MAAVIQKPLLIAVDTGVLFDWATKGEMLRDTLGSLWFRSGTPELILTPTVIQELVLATEQGESSRDRRLARQVLTHLLEWQVHPLNFIPMGSRIVSKIAHQIRREQLLPKEEVNASRVVAEAALVTADLLLTNDLQINRLEYGRLKRLLRTSELTLPLIASPRNVLGSGSLGAGANRGTVTAPAPAQVWGLRSDVGFVRAGPGAGVPRPAG